MTDPKQQDEAMRAAVTEALKAIAFGNPRRVSARDRLAALKMLGEVQGLWLQQEVEGKASLAEALRQVAERRDGGGEGGGMTIVPADSKDWRDECGAVLLLPGKDTNWAALASKEAREGGLNPADLGPAPDVG